MVVRYLVLGSFGQMNFVCIIILHKFGTVKLVCIIYANNVFVDADIMSTRRMDLKMWS